MSMGDISANEFTVALREVQLGDSELSVLLLGFSITKAALEVTEEALADTTLECSELKEKLYEEEQVHAGTREQLAGVLTHLENGMEKLEME
jgi:hypothetical protein